ncbi:MAG: hypothetical protein ACI84O_000509 [Myxococcota bacterium]|jgi:hypothetical protein
MRASYPTLAISCIIAFCIACVANGALRVVGQDAIDSFRTFNAYLDYNRAHIEDDYLLMASIAKQIEELSGNSQALEFSAYIVGYSTSAESHQRTQRDALHWAEIGVKWLTSSVDTRDRPFSGLQLAAYIYAERIMPYANSHLAHEQMLNNFEIWLACGGGPSPVSSLTAQAYRAYLGVEIAERDNHILSLMTRIDSPQ